MMDITAALYLHVAKHDPRNPSWADRDRIFWSGGHKAPALYVGLAFAGFFDKLDLGLLRRLRSPLQGHPHWLKLPGVEVSTGSLGQGLSIAVGMALAARLNGKQHKIFCIMGDGEQQEGQVWEAAMEAGHFHLNSIVAIVDCNRLQIGQKAHAAEAASKDAMEMYCKKHGWKIAFFEGETGAPRTGIIDAIAFRLGRKDSDLLDIRLIQLKGGNAGVTGREIARLKKATTGATVKWMIAEFDGETLHLLPGELEG